MYFYRSAFVSVVILLVACESKDSQHAAQQLFPKEPCNIIHQPCVVSADDVSLQLSFSKKIQALSPFQVTLEMLAGRPDNVSGVTAAFSMNGMKMGVNRYRFLSTAPGSWSANVILPICVTGRSDWKIDVEIETENVRQRFEVPFAMEK
ncbi:MAG: hypothetical protein V3V12_07125 [Gammaproteobacteria bacterium]